MSQLRKIGELEEQNRKLIKDNEALKDENKVLRSQVELGFWGLIKKAFKGLVK